MPSTNSAPMSVDDSHAYTRTSSWMTNGSSGVSTGPRSISSMSFAADRGNPSSAASSLPSSLPQQKQPQPSVSQPFDPSGNLPDLMPIMFPSGDPFAYPTQPMSTLEDDHFKNDRVGNSAQYTFEPGSQRATAPSTSSAVPTSAAVGASTPTFDAYTNIPVFPSGPPGGVAGGLPPHLQHLNHTPSRVQSPPSHTSTPADMVQSPDLVSIPNQNFMWQSFSFQQPSLSTDQQQSQQQMTGTNDMRNVGTGMDGFSPMGTGMDMGVSLDDLFNLGGGAGASGSGNDDWGQWMSMGT